MEFLSDIFLAAGAFSAALYCMVLSQHLKKLRGLDQDLGGAIAVLSRQVDEMTKILTDAQTTAQDSASKLEYQTERATMISDKLGLLISAFDDFDLPAPVQAESDDTMETPCQTAEDPSVFVRSPLRLRAAS